MCVYAHAHILHVGYSDVSPGVKTRHLESLEEFQMYCRNSIHIYRAVYEVHVHTYICWAAAGLTAFLFSFNIYFLSHTRKEEDVSKTTYISNLKWIWAHRPSIKGTRLFLIVIKAIIVIIRYIHTITALHYEVFLYNALPYIIRYMRMIHCLILQGCLDRYWCLEIYLIYLVSWHIPYMSVS